MVLGVTGGIASGKSMVAAMFAELGAVLLSADQLAREAVEPGSAGLARVVETFGRGVLAEDGSLDRERLGQVVFADPGARRALECILHPQIAELAEGQLALLRKSGAALIIYEAPLLFEAGAERRVDQSLVVLVDPGQQLARLMERDQVTAEQARARIAAQWPQADKLLRADYVIDNSGSVEQTRQSVSLLFHSLVSGSRQGVTAQR